MWFFTKLVINEIRKIWEALSDKEYRSEFCKNSFIFSIYIKKQEKEEEQRIMNKI